MVGRALPGQWADNRAPLQQGRPIAGLDANKARRLAQGFDERSVEVMLHLRKDSTNSPGVLGTVLSGVHRAHPRSLKSIHHGHN